jgi:hypothetical protein
MGVRGLGFLGGVGGGLGLGLGLRLGLMEYNTMFLDTCIAVDLVVVFVIPTTIVTVWVVTQPTETSDVEDGTHVFTGVTNNHRVVRVLGGRFRGWVFRNFLGGLAHGYWLYVYVCDIKIDLWLGCYMVSYI